MKLKVSQLKFFVKLEKAFTLKQSIQIKWYIFANTLARTPLKEVLSGNLAIHPGKPNKL